MHKRSLKALRSGVHRLCALAPEGVAALSAQSRGGVGVGVFLPWHQADLSYFIISPWPAWFYFSLNLNFDLQPGLYPLPPYYIATHLLGA